MKNLMITVGLTLFASSTLSANEALTEQDLMNHYVAELESKVIGQSFELYDIDAVFSAVKKHQQYLMLCSHKFASNKCKKAALDLKVLDDTLTTHFKFQNDLSEMWRIKESLSTQSRNENNEKWKELRLDYYQSLACGLASGEVDQDCMSRLNHKEGS